MDTHLLDLNLLRVLVGAVATRSVTRMGERLGLSQPAASRAMAKLRAQLGDRVLVRTSTGYTPTSRALAMLPAAEATLAAGERIFAAEAFSPATSTRRFALASTDYGAVTVLAPLLPAFAAAAPHAALRDRSRTIGAAFFRASGPRHASRARPGIGVRFSGGVARARPSRPPCPLAARTCRGEVAWFLVKDRN